MGNMNKALFSALVLGLLALSACTDRDYASVGTTVRATQDRKYEVSLKGRVEYVEQTNIITKYTNNLYSRVKTNVVIQGPDGQVYSFEVLGDEIMSLDKKIGQDYYIKHRNQLVRAIVNKFIEMGMTKEEANEITLSVVEAYLAKAKKELLELEREEHATHSEEEKASIDAQIQALESLISLQNQQITDGVLANDAWH